MIADQLRRQADTFIELDYLKAGVALNTVQPRVARGYVRSHWHHEEATLKRILQDGFDPSFHSLHSCVPEVSISPVDLSVSLPIEVVVLNCWVTDTNETPCASNRPRHLLNDLSTRSTSPDFISCSITAQHDW
jgi:hypothetical protein